MTTRRRKSGEVTIAKAKVSVYPGDDIKNAMEKSAADDDRDVSSHWTRAAEFYLEYHFLNGGDAISQILKERRSRLETEKNQNEESV